MAGLLDFLQAASNEAAGTVSAPVDGLAWLLRKAGIPVNAPIGGSDWMEQRGLTRPVKQSAAQVAGATAGLLSPVAAATKAPQIASGLLQAGKNLAAPRTLNPQAGAIVWHGSPHKFDKFDSSKIGTGEGAQAYGHGLYLAEAQDVANQYATGLTAREGTKFADDVTLQQKMWLSSELRKAAEKIGQDIGSPAATYTAINHVAGAPIAYNNQGGKMALDMLQENLSPEAVSFIRSKVTPPVGSLYKVDLPDDMIARMLDWDKPLSQQAPEVLNSIKSSPVGRAFFNNYGQDIDYGQAFYRYMAEDKRMGGKAAEKLRQAGIPGIRYLDGGSRGAGSGTSNFVVFPGNEGLLKIIERNGQPLP